jgi:hypothetical protein
MLINKFKFLIIVACWKRVQVKIPFEKEGKELKSSIAFYLSLYKPTAKKLDRGGKIIFKVK